ncbi:importin-5 [Tanacetum coccineum]
MIIVVGGRGVEPADPVVKGHFWKLSMVGSDSGDVGIPCEAPVWSSINFPWLTHLLFEREEKEEEAIVEFLKMVWYIKGHTTTLILVIKEHKKVVTCFALLQPENCLLSGSADTMLRISFLIVNGCQEATAQEALELLIGLARTELRFLRRQLVEVLRSMLQVAKAESLEEGTRHLEIEFLIKLSESRERAPGMMRKSGTFI